MVGWKRISPAKRNHLRQLCSPFPKTSLQCSRHMIWAIALRLMIFPTNPQNNKTSPPSAATRFCQGISPAALESQIVPVEEEPAPPKFTSEPTTLAELQDMYVIENKVPGRQPGSTLMITAAQRRDGSKHEMVENQPFKMWLVSHLKSSRRQAFTGLSSLYFL